MDPLTLLKDKLNGSRQAIGEFLLSGGARDYEAYIRATARAATLDSVIQEIEDIERRYLES